MSLTMAKIREVAAIFDAVPRSETVEVELDVWLLMNAIADFLEDEAQ